ncbi:DUF885 domain-containing protein [Sulfidibacter corallicola]|uniref:DUF885 domain-containing protein n=1 Tax=Sulfidibacter corallicola TaxID=2818388 RepID=A0A8A4TWN3_SULCO|nr:DUF885 domain-containing protein [Sulfidibacter corallicola]QTD53893.1 DUF885 domain-containing protein [Sulfidibacter corallicola]
MNLWMYMFLVLSAADPAGEQLNRLFDNVRDWRAREYPIFATHQGIHDHNDKLASMKLADLKRRTADLHGFLTRLDAIPAAELTHQERISADIFRDLLEDEIRDFDLGGYALTLTSDYGFHIEMVGLPDIAPFRNTKDYENYLARLERMPAYFGEHIDLLRMGLKRGWTLPKEALSKYSGTISAHVLEDPTESAFYAPFKSFPATVSEADRARLDKAGKAAIGKHVIPAYRTFLKFMDETYIPGARKTIGASQMEDGKNYYRHVIRRYTTLDLDPKDVHEMGLAEVKRIRAEMLKVIEQTGFEGDFAAFLNFLRTDPRFYAKTPEELLKEAAYLSKKMDGKLPSLFKTLPRQPYGVEPVPDYLAPGYTGGRYVPASIESTRPGTYWVNTYNLESRPLYVLEALTLHEAVPGHHLQSALSQELSELPAFRRNLYLSAFGEGWALYSEWLGLEAGFYQDPYSNFGRLTYEMWRACRLVVDTGIHAMGWTRQQSIDYLAKHTALSIHECTTETDRYICWPGQALSYKIGELKIKALREKAERELGVHFDRRQFHDAVLANGCVPMPILEREIDRFIEVNKTNQTAP